MAKKQLFAFLLAFVGITLWQVEQRTRSQKDVEKARLFEVALDVNQVTPVFPPLESTKVPKETTVDDVTERAMATVITMDAGDVQTKVESVSTTSKLETASTIAEAAKPKPSTQLSNFRRLPKHLAELPGSKAWRPRDFQDLPELPAKVWVASRSEMPPNHSYPLVQGVLRRLGSMETVRIEVYGGSMTFGSECCKEDCKLREGQCAWPSQFAAYLQDAYPAAQLYSYARGGCNLECALTEMVVAQKSAKVAPDMILLDFSQNGWGGKDYRLEEFVRICHLFLPNTLLVLIYNRDMGSQSHNYKDDHDLAVLRPIAKHYGLPLLNYEKAMEEYQNLGGQNSSMWPRQVAPTAWPDWAVRHPLWPGHAFYADMLADWLNSEMSSLEALPPNAAVVVPPPVLQKPSDVMADQDWIRPMQSLDLEKLDVCLFPLTSHLARNPESTTPLQSPSGQWRLMEDRKGKPGWIVTEQNDTMFFNITLSGKPKVAIQYLRSYEKIGTAEIQIVSPFLWKCKQLEGQGNRKNVWKLLGLWPQRVSITVGAVFTVADVNVTAAAQMGTTQAVVALRLVQGSKFKLLSVISC